MRRILVANRGEIAVRVIRTCQRLGIRTVLAAAEPDLDSAAARLADQTVPVGPARPEFSYLDTGRILRAAQIAGADAIHPGYGFLAENPELARGCEAAGIVYIGPTGEQLAAVGDKLNARELAVRAGLPVAPGGYLRTPAEAPELAARIGYPVLVKAAGGGGGRGMQLVREPAELTAAVDRGMAEARAAFADQRVYLESYVERGRHVEVQLLGDGQGGVLHLGDRDCSVQRRYQKLIEEACAPGLDADLRAAIRTAAVAFGARLGYRGAGTVEFLVDTAAGAAYFLEMNARIQVEHPVTEEVYRVDLVAEQIAIAEGRPLRPELARLVPDGHAIECRINAEDPARDFQPSPGTVEAAWFPAGDGIRVDTHLQPGAAVPPFYDSLLAKVIAHGRDREQALDRLAAALRRCEIRGVSTNLPLLARLVDDPEFRAGGVPTTWLATRGALAHD
ncbi:MAG: ATP-grasp domain-containing protein [Micromonosporaceae bacterium]|nr:ATP-grasp domain-containing protein [Micromonosporaceae bacterium]